MSTLGGVMSTWGGVMSTLRGVMSTYVDISRRKSQKVAESRRKSHRVAQSRTESHRVAPGAARPRPAAAVHGASSICHHYGPQERRPRGGARESNEKARWGEWQGSAPSGRRTSDTRSLRQSAWADWARQTRAKESSCARRPFVVRTYTFPPCPPLPPALFSDGAWVGWFGRAALPIALLRKSSVGGLPSMLQDQASLCVRRLPRLPRGHVCFRPALVCCTPGSTPSAP